VSNEIHTKGRFIPASCDHGRGERRECYSQDCAEAISDEKAPQLVWGISYGVQLH